MAWGLAAAPCVRAEDVSNLDEAWKKLSRLLINEAYADFESLVKSGPDSSDSAKLGLALTLLNKQPKTNANIQRAAELLEELIKSAPVELALTARYYLGRIEQVHRTPPNLSKASEIYADLIRRAPQHPLAQQARVKASLIAIYDESSLEEKRAKLADLEVQAAELTDPASRRDMHLVLADAYANLFADDAATLRCLLLADEAGIQGAKNRADYWIRIAELARRTGQDDLALRYYRQFLENFRRDDRYHTIQQHVVALEGASEA